MGGDMTYVGHGGGLIWWFDEVTEEMAAEYEDVFM